MIRKLDNVVISQVFPLIILYYADNRLTKTWTGSSTDFVHCEMFCPCHRMFKLSSLVSKTISVVVERVMLLTLEMVDFGVVTEFQEYRCSLVKTISPYQCWGKVQQFLLEGINDGICSQLQYIAFDISTLTFITFFVWKPSQVSM